MKRKYPAKTKGQVQKTKQVYVTQLAYLGFLLVAFLLFVLVLIFSAMVETSKKLG
jgi:hypothetical protein